MSAILLLSLLTNDPFRFEPVPMDPAKLPAPVEIPEAPADQAGNAATERPPSADSDVLHAPADPRPVVFLYTSPHCSAGDQMRAAIRRGDFEAAGLDVQEKSAPDWYTLCPTFHWQSSAGGWVKYPRDEGSFRGVNGLLTAFDLANPGARLKATASRATGAGPFDQIAKFTGPGGSFTFKPDTPIAASLDDRTSIRFPSIQGRYTVRDGKVELKLEPPLPTGEYRKWLRFGFQITGGGGPENVTPKTMDVRIDTNRGPQRITVTMEPQK